MSDFVMSQYANKDDLMRALKVEVERQRSVIERAHSALTKSSCEPSQRVFEAAGILSELR